MQGKQARICWMKVKQIAWKIGPQAAWLIYRHMVRTWVRTCGKCPMQYEKSNKVSMGTMGRESVTIVVQWEYSHPSHAPAQVVTPCHASWCQVTRDLVESCDTRAHDLGQRNGDGNRQLQRIHKFKNSKPKSWQMKGRLNKLHCSMSEATSL